MALFKIRSKTLHTTAVRLTRRYLATSSEPPLNIGQITAAFQPPDTTAVVVVVVVEVGA